MGRISESWLFLGIFLILAEGQNAQIPKCECALFAIDNWVGRRAFGLLQQLDGMNLVDCTDDNLLVCQQYCASAALRWSEKNNLNTQDPETGVTYGQKFCSILHAHEVDATYPGLYIGSFEKVGQCGYLDYWWDPRSAIYEICCTADGQHDLVCPPPEVNGGQV